MKKAFIIGKGCVKLSLDAGLYTLNTIYAAGYVFLDKACVYLDKDNKGKIIVALFPKEKKEDLRKLGMDFYNELINYAHYFGSLKANAEAVKLLLQRALFSVAPTLMKESEEKEIDDLIKDLEEEEKKSKKK
ncbi:MAG: hypothetical protein PHV55_08720 [Candidatus Omnitrophica bacterium]|nr:hypothetical protein [Candidatus Omnitrophota bacterium]